MSNETILKSVFCSYLGRVTVYDVAGQKVKELSGQLTYDKYMEIEKRSDPDITEFEGLEKYRCIACELKKQKELESNINEVFKIAIEPFIKGLGSST